ncbi:MAG: glucose 1-dehydrogenase [Desulfobacteraceae bacterium]|nr:glucose 1-dehydrogenase [Desulfobacteraceae bacterium]
MKKNLFDLTGKVALITGGTRGIGRAIALALAQTGANVVATSRNKDHVEKVTLEIMALGRQSIQITTDVTRADDRKRMIQEIVKSFGRIDIFVSNAGGNPLFKRPEDTTEAEFDHIINLNLKASFFCCLEAGKEMIRQKSGRIIIMGSIFSRVTGPRVAPYTISKTALLGMTRALALDWHKHNIRVNCLAPGYVDTDFTADVVKNPALYKASLEEIPLKRYAKPEEIAKVAVMLASDASDYMVGETIWVDGGYAIH